VRAYANVADELERAGYSGADSLRIKQQLDHYVNVREIIRKASGESLDDLKAPEADMRHLLDTYIEADEPRKISPFDNMGLLELIVKTGIAAAITTQLGGLEGNRNAIAETIENNVRRKILKEHLSDPAYYEKMSTLLDEIITARRATAIEYAEYLKRVAALARRVEAGLAEDTPEPLKNSPALRALYNNLKKARERPPRGWPGRSEDRVHSFKRRDIGSGNQSGRRSEASPAGRLAGYPGAREHDQRGTAAAAEQ
jgi:type I restriction enzyme R subunit